MRRLRLSSRFGRAAKGRRRPASRRTRWIRRFVAAVALASTVTAGAILSWNAGWPVVVLDSVRRTAETTLAGAGLRVDQIYLKGRHQASVTEVSGALAVARGTPLLSVDLEAARQRLERLSWVRAASVRRVFPDALRVVIAEWRPVALWQRRKQLVLINDEGAVIPHNDLEGFSDLLVVVGADAPAHAAELMTMLAAAPELEKRVDAAVRVGSRRWNIRMDNGIYVWLPETGARDAWSNLVQLEREHGLLEQDLVAIDLRFPGRLIVRTRESVSPQRQERADGKGGRT